LNCAVAAIDPAGENGFIHYVSFSPELIQKIEKIIRLKIKDYAIPKKYWPGERILSQKAPIWYPRPNEIIRRMFPRVPEGIAKQAFKLLRFGENDQICFLPLVSGERTIGALPIWGSGLGPGDSPILEVFASQVSGILQNVTNYENEVQRKDELARSNAMIVALSNVAARLDTTSNLAQVFDTLGNELKKIRINCMVGTLDDAKQVMKIEYISITQEIIDWANKLGAFWPKEVVIPRRVWPTDKAVTEKVPYWDPDPIGSTSKMFPFVPRQLFLKTFEMAGMNPNDQVCYLPMLNEEDVIGILAVWGPDLRHEDIPGLSVFANQVTTAIRNTRLYDQAQEEIINRTQAEARVQTALNEKEVLLKEVHHRVKNNLQVISSLLNLQAGQISDPKTVDVLRESQNRVRSMALIHEKLYQSDDLARVDFGGYLQNLVNTLAQNYRVKSERLSIKVNSDNILLNLDTAIPCGLIVNELVSNSMKYAFPAEFDGTIEVSCRQAQGGWYRLVVCDNGVGLPAGFDFAKSPSLGLKLVTSLVNQIEGQLVVDGKPGTRFEINFKES
jgi:two-component sensor histidine kinase